MGCVLWISKGIRSCVCLRNHEVSIQSSLAGKDKENIRLENEAESVGRATWAKTLTNYCCWARRLRPLERAQMPMLFICRVVLDFFSRIISAPSLIACKFKALLSHEIIDSWTESSSSSFCLQFLILAELIAIFDSSIVIVGWSKIMRRDFLRKYSRDGRQILHKPVKIIILPQNRLRQRRALTPWAQVCACPPEKVESFSRFRWCRRWPRRSRFD